MGDPQKVLGREVTDVITSGMLYQVVVQYLLLYGLEIWVIIDPILKTLEGFHMNFSRGMV